MPYRPETNLKLHSVLELLLADCMAEVVALECLRLDIRLVHVANHALGVTQNKGCVKQAMYTV